MAAVFRPRRDRGRDRRSRNPFQGELGQDLDGATLEYIWDGEPGGVAFSVACYDTTAIERAACVDVFIELDDGSDDGAIYELVCFTVGAFSKLRADEAGGVPGASPPDDAPRIPWNWLSDDVHAWVWAYAADWWQHHARRPRSQRRSQPRGRRRSARLRHRGRS